METNFYIQDKKRHVKILPQRAALYMQCELIEAKDEQDQYYYIFFYKEQFLTVKKVAKIKGDSFIGRAFKKGIVFLYADFLLEKLQQNHPLKERTIKECISGKTAIEAAIIYSYFDGLLEKDELTEQLTKLFYQYRRNGKFSKAYQLLKNIALMLPRDEWIQETANDLSFSKYKEVYDQPLSSLVQEDRDYVENWCWQHRAKGHGMLMQLFNEEGRACGQIGLYYEKLVQKPSMQVYDQFREYVLPEGKAMELYMKLSEKIPQFMPLRRDVFAMYCSLQQYEAAIQFYLVTPFPPSESEQSQLQEAIVHVNWQNSSIEVKQLLEVILSFRSHLPVLEKMIAACAKALLSSYELPEVEAILKRVKDQDISLPILNKIDHMAILENDPDGQAKLGEYYYDFHLLDHALDCFSFEMELHPEDLAPVKWLCKLYQEKQMPEEANAYKQMLVQMQK